MFEMKNYSKNALIKRYYCAIINRMKTYETDHCKKSIDTVLLNGKDKTVFLHDTAN